MNEGILRSALRGGLILGAFFTLRFLITTLGSGVFISISSWVLVAIIVVAVWKLSEQYRDNENGGYISYGKALGFVLFSFFIASIISAVVKIFYFTVINADYLADVANQALITMQDMGTKVTVEIEQMMNSILSPIPWSLLVILGNMFLGLIVGLIVAAMVKKEKSIFDSE